MSAVEFIVLALATFRLANLLADPNQTGPWDTLSWLRVKAGMRYDAHSIPFGTNTFAEGMLCMYCNSIWFGAAWALFYYLAPQVAFWAALPFALSGATLLFQKVFEYGMEAKNGSDR